MAQPFKSNNQDKYAAKKFLKEFREVIEALDIEDTDELSEHQVATVLDALGFLKTPANNESFMMIDNREWELVEEVNRYLCETGGASLANLGVFLLAVIGIYDLEVIDKSHQ